MSTQQVPQRVLVVEDEESVRSALVLNLAQAGYLVEGASDAREALLRCETKSCAVVLSDVRLPGMDVGEFGQRLRALQAPPALVLMSGASQDDLQKRAAKAGATAYLTKPFSMEQLLRTLTDLAPQAIRSERSSLRSTPPAAFRNLVAQSESMREVFETVRRVSQFSTTILVTGESGTGKELLARAIHESSPRRKAPFIAINCGAIPEALMESELFGHKKGAFTDASRDKPGLFEEAHGGTLFLDEIGEMPLSLQVKLLRALQERHVRRVGDEALIPVDVRVIAATLRDLEDDVREGRFRDDLYYRLNVVSLHLPPLRERTDDIPLLVQHFLEKHAARLGLPVPTIAPETMQLLTRYHWRGNVRELENCIERALVLSDDAVINPSLLPRHIREDSQRAAEAEFIEPIDEKDLSIKKRTRALEIELILKALQRTKGNRTHAARVLEISHRALLYKLKEYGLSDMGKEDDPNKERGER